MNYPTVISTPEIEKLFPGVYALPTTFILDRDGKLAQKHVGMLNAALTELETQALAGPRARDRGRGRRRRRQGRQVARRASRTRRRPTRFPASISPGSPPSARDEVLKALNTEHCTCGCGLTLAQCRIDDPDCTRQPAARPGSGQEDRRPANDVPRRAAVAAARSARRSLSDRRGRPRAPQPRRVASPRPSLPDAVVFPTSTADVQAIVAACAEHRVPMTPFGAGSSLEGHVIPLHGGISVDLTRMNRIVRLNVGGSRRHRRGRRHAQAAREAPAVDAA